MRNLLLFLIKNKDHFVFAVALFFSFALLFNRNNDEMSVIRGFSSDLVSFLSTPLVKVKSLANVNEENQYLREKNLQLNLQLESILYAADENKKWRKNAARFRNLDDMAKKIRELEKKLSEK